MYNENYRKIFSFKTLDYDDVDRLLNVFKNIEDLKIEEIIVSRKLKNNNIEKNEKQSFKKSEELLDYLNKDINFLDEIEILFSVENDKNICLKYDNNKWILSYEQQSIVMDGIILNLKQIFRYNLINLYKSKKDIIGLIVSFSWLIFYFIFWFKSANVLITIFSIVIFIMALLNLFIKNRPYKNSKFLKNNKDSIRLNIIFYILGTITPYIIDIIKIIIKLITNGK